MHALGSVDEIDAKQEKPELAALSWQELQAYRDELGVQVGGDAASD
jgi:hypothetical protein